MTDTTAREYGMDLLDELLARPHEPVSREAPKHRDVNGRYAQVKAAVTAEERDLFYHRLPEAMGKPDLSNLIRDQLIELCVAYGLLPNDYK